MGGTTRFGLQLPLPAVLVSSLSTKSAYHGYPRVRHGTRRAQSSVRFISTCFRMWRSESGQTLPRPRSSLSSLSHSGASQTPDQYILLGMPPTASDTVDLSLSTFSVFIYLNKCLASDYHSQSHTTLSPDRLSHKR